MALSNLLWKRELIWQFANTSHDEMHYFIAAMPKLEQWQTKIIKVQAVIAWRDGVNEHNIKDLFGPLKIERK